jgi:hypothetical protein
MINIAIYWFTRIFKPHHFYRPTKNAKVATTPDKKSSYLRNRKKPKWVV